MAGRPIRYACMLSRPLSCKTDCDQSMQWMQCGCTMDEWIGKTVPPMTSVPLP